MRWFSRIGREYGRQDPVKAQRAEDARLRADLRKQAQQEAGEGAKAAPPQATGPSGAHRGVTHSGPETVNITGQAIGRGTEAGTGPQASRHETEAGRGSGQSGGGHQIDSGDAGPGRGDHNPYVANLGCGAINVEQSAFGQGAQVTIVGGEVQTQSGPQAEPELEAGA